MCSAQECECARSLRTWHGRVAVLLAVIVRCQRGSVGSRERPTCWLETVVRRRMRMRTLQQEAAEFNICAIGAGANLQHGRDGGCRPRHRRCSPPQSRQCQNSRHHQRTLPGAQRHVSQRMPRQGQELVRDACMRAAGTAQRVGDGTCNGHRGRSAAERVCKLPSMKVRLVPSACERESRKSGGSRAWASMRAWVRIAPARCCTLRPARRPQPCG